MCDDEPEAVILVDRQVDVLELGSTHSRVAAAALITDGGFLGLASVYVHHETGRGLTPLQEIVANWKARGIHKWLIGGDFNARSGQWGPRDVASNQNGRRVEQWASQENLFVANRPDSLPTYRNSRNHQSWIDLSILSQEAHEKLFKSCRVIEIEDEFTDHNIIETTLSTTPLAQNSQNHTQN